jgi:hypothetical protein
MGTGISSLLVTRRSLDDIRIAWINNAETANTEVFPTGCTQVNIVSMEMVNSDLSQHSIVLNFRLPKGRAVVSNDNELRLGVPESPEDGLVAERVLATLHNKLQLVVDVVRGLLLHGHHHHTKTKN